MNRKLFKNIMLLLTVAIVLAVGIFRFSWIKSTLGFIFSLFTPLIIGLVIAFLLNPVHNFFLRLLYGETKLQKRRKKQKQKKIKGSKKLFIEVGALVLTYLCFFLVLTILLVLIVPQLVASGTLFSRNLEGYLQNLKTFLEGVAKTFNMEETLFATIEGAVKDFVGNISVVIVGAIPQILDFTMSIVLWIANIVIGFILSVYVLAAKKKVLEKTENFIFGFFDERAQEKIIEVASLSFKTFSGFITGRLLDASIVGVLCFIGMSIFGFSYPLLISVIVGVSNIIPFFGPFIGGIPSAFILLMIDPWQALWFTVFLVVLQQLDGNLIGARIVGDSVGLPPLWNLAAIIIGGGLFGFVGMILGTPTLGIVYTLLNRATEKRLKKSQRRRREE